MLVLLGLDILSQGICGHSVRLLQEHFVATMQIVITCGVYIGQCCLETKGYTVGSTPPCLLGV